MSNLAAVARLSSGSCSCHPLMREKNPTLSKRGSGRARGAGWSRVSLAEAKVANAELLIEHRLSARDEDVEDGRH